MFYFKSPPLQFRVRPSILSLGLFLGLAGAPAYALPGTDLLCSSPSGIFRVSLPAVLAPGLPNAPAQVKEYSWITRRDETLDTFATRGFDDAEGSHIVDSATSGEQFRMNLRYLRGTRGSMTFVGNLLVNTSKVARPLMTVECNSLFFRAP
jgi:hypothetical protein